MDEIEFELTDLNKLIKKLNNSIGESEGRIELGYFRDEEPLGKYIRALWGRKDIERRGRYPLIQRGKEESSSGILSDLESRAIGYIFAETGYMVPRDNIVEKYERLKLRIKDYLLLKNGREIPDCRIELIEKAEIINGRLGEPKEERKDYVIGILHSVKADLSDILPTAWFINDRYARRQKTNGGLLEQFRYVH